MADTHDTPLVIQVVQHLKPGGIEMLALELLRVSDVRMMIVSLEGTAADALDAWPYLQDYQQQLYFLDKPAGKSIRTLWQLVKLCRQYKPLAVHTHHIGALLYGGLAARFAGVMHRVHTEHDAWHLQQSSAYKLQRLLLRIIRPNLVADSHLVAQELAHYFQQTSCDTILNGIDTERFIAGDQIAARMQLGLPQDIKLIGCAARLETVKNHALLLQAFATLPASTHLALAGGGSLEQALKDQCNTLKISERVHFLGALDNMVTFYQALNVFCLASDNEGLPLSLLEAQSCNVPVVATNVGGMSEAIAPESGISVEKGNMNALASALQTSLEQAPGEPPRHFITEHFSIATMAASYAALWGCDE